MTDLIPPLIGWLFFAALTLSVGAVAFRLAVLPRSHALDRATRERLSLTAARVGAPAALGVGIGLGLILLRQADALRFPGDPWRGAIAALLGTEWAHAWWWAVVGCLLLIVGCLVATRRDRPGWRMAMVGLLPLLVFPGLTGHPNAADARLIALAVDALHLTAVGVWIGGLGMVLLVGRGWLDRLVPAFSPLAIGAVVVLVGTGVAASWRMIDPIDALWTTDYGRTLVLKVGLFAVVALMGLINWRRMTPRLGSPEGDRTLRRTATAEFVVGNVVLLVSAILVRMSPPG